MQKPHYSCVHLVGFGHASPARACSWGLLSTVMAASPGILQPAKCFGELQPCHCCCLKEQPCHSFDLKERRMRTCRHLLAGRRQRRGRGRGHQLRLPDRNLRGHARRLLRGLHRQLLRLPARGHRRAPASDSLTGQLIGYFYWHVRGVACGSVCCLATQCCAKRAERRICEACNAALHLSNDMALGSC